jgi:hypothetical protein
VQVVDFPPNVAPGRIAESILNRRDVTGPEKWRGSRQVRGDLSADQAGALGQGQATETRQLIGELAISPIGIRDGRR